MRKELCAVPVPVGTIHIDTSSIPASVGQNIAQVALRGILRDYADPDVQADFQRWKAERAKKARKEEGT